MDHVSPKNDFDMFQQDFYHDEFQSFSMFNNPDHIPFNALNISNNITEYYPATINPSSLTSPPIRRSDSPDATVVAPRPVDQQAHAQQQQQQAYPHPHHHIPVPGHRDSSSSPSSSDAFQTSLPMHNIPTSAILQPPLNASLTHLAHSNLSSTSLSDHHHGRTSRASIRASPPLSSGHERSSPRVRNKSPAPDRSPKRNGGTLVHRPSRSNTASSRPARRGSNRKIKEEDDWSEFEEDDDFAPNALGDVKPERRREDIRRQRIESEQRRRDELREGYNRLKSALPPSNQKSSKASILERATVCINDLNHKTSALSGRLEELENELRRVRVLNETLMLSAAEHRSAAAAATFAAAQAGVHIPVGFQQA